MKKGFNNCSFVSDRADTSKIDALYSVSAFPINGGSQTALGAMKKDVQKRQFLFNLCFKSEM